MASRSPVSSRSTNSKSRARRSSVGQRSGAHERVAERRAGQEDDALAAGPRRLVDQPPDPHALVDVGEDDGRDRDDAKGGLGVDVFQRHEGAVVPPIVL
jgi:hypothetical protein